jgi:rubrerythrin
MVMTFTADEIFEIAEQTERNAAEFYREAAEKCSSEDTMKLLPGISVTGNKHLET